MKHSEFIVMKGEAHCLSRGFEKLRSPSHGRIVEKKIQTIEYTKKRKFKLVDVDEYDMTKPTQEAYRHLGKFWADVVTGTLYHPVTGECQSSTQIKLVLE